MSDPLPLPQHPQLRSLAEECERLGLIATVLDHKWRAVYVTSETIASLAAPGETADAIVGHSLIVQVLVDRWVEMPTAARIEWWEKFGPAMRHDVGPDDPDYEAVFGPMASAAMDLEPRVADPAIAFDRELSVTFARQKEIPLHVHDLCLRLHDESGDFIGSLYLTKPALRENVLFRLALGEVPTYERMFELREPARRSAAILFADLEASGELSRTLSSGTYFRLIRSLTDVVDSEVIVRGGMVGKHAGDGASALFVPTIGEPESKSARAAIEAARAIRAAATNLLGGQPPVLVNIGLHWGSTLTVGQISSYGRLEVTALGDEMNEAARIEHVATRGAILASKLLVERLSDDDAASLELEPETMRFTTVTALGGEGKQLRDAGNVAVAAL